MQRLRTRLRASASTGAPPSLSLDFLGLNQTLDSRITFSRGSNATLVDSTGKVTYAPNNLLPYSEQFDNAAWTKTNTTITANAGAAPDGTTTADRFNATSPGGLDQTAALIIGVAYIISVWAKSNGASKDTFVLYGDGNQASSPFTATATWQRFSYRFTSANTGPRGNGIFTNGANAADVLIWGAQLEAVTYQTTPSTYNATTASAYYGPRFDYDPVTLNPKGLLIEEQRTNLLLRSQEFDNAAAWVNVSGGTGSAPVITANAGIAPDGTQTADQVVFNSGAGTASADRSIISSSSISVTASTTYTHSIFVKGPAGTKLVMRGAAGSSYASITLTGGWDRFTGSEVAGGTTAYFEIGIRQSVTGTINSTATVLLWGAQLEAGAFATSYIPTVASTVTRSADVASMTGTNFSSWYNQSEGSFVIDVDSATTGYRTNLQVDDGTLNNRILIQTNNVATAQQYYVVVGGSAVVNTAAQPYSPAGSKTSATYKLNDYAYSVNGTAVTTDTSAAVPAVNRMFLGTEVSSNYLNGHIRRIAYYPVRLANYQLQGLTA